MGCAALIFAPCAIVAGLSLLALIWIVYLLRFSIGYHLRRLWWHRMH